MNSFKLFLFISQGIIIKSVCPERFKISYDITKDTLLKLCDDIKNDRVLSDRACGDRDRPPISVTRVSRNFIYIYDM